MNKLVGSCFLIIGGVLFRWVQLRERKRQRDCLESILSALRWMEGEIDGQQRPLPTLFRELAQRGTPESQGFFRTLDEGVRMEQRLDQNWKAAAEVLPLPEECLRILSTLGEQLNCPTERACAAIQQVYHRLEHEREQMEAESPQAEKQLTVFSFSAATLLIVLLI